MKALLILSLLYTGLPDTWQAELLLSHEVQGLQMDTWQLHVNQAQVTEWRSTHRPRCTRISPRWAAEWHCISEDTLYSLLQGEAGYIWVQSERARQQHPVHLPFEAEVVSQYQGPHEQVSVLQTRQPLYELQARMSAQLRQANQPLLMHEQSDAGFVLQWSETEPAQGKVQVALTAQRDPDGLVQLVYTRLLEQGGTL